MRRTSALIVGGGPAGAAAAIALARGGLAPLLLERNLETRDALCGGFLSWTTIARLAAVGVDPFALGAHRIDRVALPHRAREAEARLPAPAAALSRRALDAALLAQAEKTGAGIERGITARAFEAGMAIAIASGSAVAGAILRGEPATLFQPRFARRLRRPVSLAAAL